MSDTHILKMFVNQDVNLRIYREARTYRIDQESGQGGVKAHLRFPGLPFPTSGTVQSKKVAPRFMLLEVHHTEFCMPTFRLEFIVLS